LLGSDTRKLVYGNFEPYTVYPSTVGSKGEVNESLVQSCD